jgi:hypothetical protein
LKRPFSFEKDIYMHFGSQESPNPVVKELQIFHLIALVFDQADLVPLDRLSLSISADQEA